MSKRVLVVLMGHLVLLVCSASVSAQSYVEFLGPKYSDQVKYSPKYEIPYRDNGFDDPLKRAKRKARKRGAPEWVVDEIKAFPGAPDEIGL